MEKILKDVSHSQGDACPVCFSIDKNKGGHLTEKDGPFGTFIGCSNYPKCRYTYNIYMQDSSVLTEQMIRNKKKGEKILFSCKI